MCGVFGWIKFEHQLTKDEIRNAQKCVESMIHRGPDSHGEWISDYVYMGHRRLSIIDLSSKADQPFIDEDKRYILIFNGEIYNYLELKQELMKKGFKFYTSSDTEVLLIAFKAWGTKAFLKLDGMFAGSIHDTVTGKHYIFRDYLGQKPLYYYLYQNGIVYASELRAILNLERFNWHLDLGNFLKFLTNSCYMWDTTPLRGVKKLLPGCYLDVETKNGNTTLLRFWDSIPGENLTDIDFSEAIIEFQRLLERSCETSMRSDVPYGVFLSGGIDSSLILNSCYKFNPEISTYSVKMGEEDFDESSKALAVTKLLKIKERKTYLLDHKSMQNSIEDFFSFIDEPHGDPGFINSYFLARESRPEIKVALAGDGADELFAGYVSFLALGKEKWLQNMPFSLLLGLNKVTKHFLTGSDTYMGLQFKTLLFLQGFPAHHTTRFPLWLSAISPEELQKLCPWQNTAFFSRMGEADTLFEDFRKVLSVVEEKSHPQMLLYFYQKFFLPEFVCMHTDRAAMQNSLEVRSPFLSVSLIEFANSLPEHFKIGKKELKIILRHTLAKDGFPKDIYKQKKHGFTFPVARWLKGSLKIEMEKQLSKNKWENNLISTSYLERLKQEHLSNKRNNYRILFNLMVFRKWLDKYPQVSVEL